MNANFTRVDGGLSFPPVWEIVSLSHYGLQSFQEFKTRMGKLYVAPGQAAALEERRCALAACLLALFRDVRSEYKWPFLQTCFRLSGS